MAPRDNDSRSSRSRHPSSQPYPPIAPGQTPPSAQHGFNQQAGYTQAHQQGGFQGHPTAYQPQQYTQGMYYDANWLAQAPQIHQYTPAGQQAYSTFPPQNIAPTSPVHQTQPTSGQHTYHQAPALIPGAVYAPAPQISAYQYLQAHLPQQNPHMKLLSSLESTRISLEDQSLKRLDELSQAQSLIDVALGSYNDLQKFIQLNPGCDILAISFSHVKQKHLESIGVSFLKKSGSQGTPIMSVIQGLIDQRSAHFPEALRTNQPISRLYKSFWSNTANPQSPFGLLNMIKVILATVGRRPEARGRILIDQFVLHLTVFLRGVGAIPFVMPELILASSQPSSTQFQVSPTSVIVKYKSSALVLTGSVDYSMLFVGMNEDSLARALEIPTQQVQQVMRGVTAAGTLDELIQLKISSVLLNREISQVLLIEAKKENLPKNATLETCVPQVVAECLATMSKTNKDALAWCLTNGVEWIFGVVKGDAQGSVKRQCIQLAPFGFNQNAVSADHLITIFQTLLAWCTVDANDIWETLMKIP